jgi:hypothetical protein
VADREPDMSEIDELTDLRMVGLTNRVAAAVSSQIRQFVNSSIRPFVNLSIHQSP